MATYLERYRQGEREQVWTELVALGPAVHEERIYGDATAVAREIMTRAHHNITLLVERLTNLDYRFFASHQTWEQPDAQLRKKTAIVDRRWGPLPLVFRAWFDVVGQVCLMGAHPRLSCYLGLVPDEQQGPVSDPLVVGYEGLEEGPGEEGDSTASQSSCILEFAPDVSHKSNYSGGGNSWIVLPSPGFDARLGSESAWHGMYFVPYLRRCFQWGGFPGLAVDGRAGEAARAELQVLTSDLLPI